MKIFNLISLAVAIITLAACDNNTNEANKNIVNQTASNKQDRPFVVANNFSDSTWKSGILQKEGRSNIFYFLQNVSKPINIVKGDVVFFAKSGKAVVSGVTQSVPDQNGNISFFITVDKDLDPVNDGYPNKIYLK